MTAKRYLKQIHKNDWLIKSKCSEIMQLSILATSITAATDNERVQSSGSKDRVGDLVSKIADAKQELIDMAMEHVQIKRKISNQIDSLDCRVEYIKVLHLRYIDYLSYSDIAEEMNYTLRQIMNLHKEALDVFEETYFSELNIS